MDASQVTASQLICRFAASLGNDQAVSGFVYHTVSVAIHAWLSHPCDFRAAIQAAVACGGDTDTVAAIVGGIVGAGVGKSGTHLVAKNSILDGAIRCSRRRAFGRKANTGARPVSADCACAQYAIPGACARAYRASYVAALRNRRSASSTRSTHLCHFRTLPCSPCVWAPR